MALRLLGGHDLRRCSKTGTSRHGWAHEIPAPRLRAAGASAQQEGGNPSRLEDGERAPDCAFAFTSARSLKVVAASGPRCLAALASYHALRSRNHARRRQCGA